jgi:predicted amidophosphoribosyltransferase
VTDLDERRKQVDGLYQIDATQTKGRSVLLFDDLYRSGTTMNAITDQLLGPGQALIVRAVTITKTRSNH